MSFRACPSRCRLPGYRIWGLGFGRFLSLWRVRKAGMQLRKAWRRCGVHTRSAYPTPPSAVSRLAPRDSVLRSWLSQTPALLAIRLGCSGTRGCFAPTREAMMATLASSAHSAPSAAPLAPPLSGEQARCCCAMMLSTCSASWVRPRRLRRPKRLPRTWQIGRRQVRRAGRGIAVQCGSRSAAAGLPPPLHVPCPA